MEAVYYAARANLRRLLILHPTWTRAQLAQATGMSRSWVDKWEKRLLSAPLDDEQVLRGLSRAPHHPPPRLDPVVIDRLLEIRDDPPEGLGRTPGPKAILYYLNRDETLKERKLRLPKSTRTVHRLLRENGRIASRLPTLSNPLERPAPMQHWQLDFKDASSVPADPHGKKQHVVETLNIIDKGTSVLVAHHVRADFTAETALTAVAQTFAEHGLPASITLDRDTRWVGAPQGSDFPAALVRFCHALGVAVLLCDPHHPQQNGFVERYHRTLNQECLQRERPKTLDEVRQVTEAFATHSNWQRPLKADQLWQSASSGRLSQPALSPVSSRSGQSRRLVKPGERTASGAAGQSSGLREGGFVPLLHLQQARWPESHLSYPGQGAELAGGLSPGVSSLSATQRLTSASAALSGVSSTHAARSLDSTALACVREVERSLRLSALLTRCQEAFPLTRWVSHTGCATRLKEKGFHETNHIRTSVETLP